ncbi:MAG: hypothetical protein IKX61_00015 [Prevotella sp.]|nr:hypothetical protein [Prevotella sp.]
MKKTVFTKSVLRVLPLGLFFMVVGFASCNSALDTGTSLSMNLNPPADSLVETGIEGCYSARVAGTSYFADSLCVRILEAPEGVSEDQPHEGQLVRIKKEDLHKSDVMAGDTIEFRIIEYEALYIPPVVYHDRFYFDFCCKVGPCE